MIVQVSRFDRLKDPIGLIRAYRIVKKTIDCQLVLAGSFAVDDPEATQVLAEMNAQLSDDPDIMILNLPADSHLEINALQRLATVIVQKSIREGIRARRRGSHVEGKTRDRKPCGRDPPAGIINGSTGFFVYSDEVTAPASRN